jgi:hypothetical protein
MFHPEWQSLVLSRKSRNNFRAHHKPNDLHLQLLQDESPRRTKALVRLQSSSQSCEIDDRLHEASAKSLLRNMAAPQRITLVLLRFMSSSSSSEQTRLPS